MISYKDLIKKEIFAEDPKALETISSALEEISAKGEENIFPISAKPEENSKQENKKTNKEQKFHFLFLKTCYFLSCFSNKKDKKEISEFILIVLNDESFHMNAVDNLYTFPTNPRKLFKQAMLKILEYKENDIFNKKLVAEIFNKEAVVSKMKKEYKPDKKMLSKIHNLWLYYSQSYFINSKITLKTDQNFFLQESDNFIYKAPKSKGEKHKLFNNIKSTLLNNLPIYLYGPTGTGKSFVVSQIAEELKLNFHLINSPQDSFQLLGYRDAHGNYHSTPYREAYEKGGIFFLDELDNSPEEVLVCINSHIGSNFADFPDKKVKKHEKFRFISAGNTKGRGESTLYSARNRIDESTLNRFVIFDFNFDSDLELKLVNNNEKFYRKFLTLRSKYQELNKPQIFSTRSLIYAYTLNKLKKNFGIIENMLTGENNVFKPYSNEAYDLDLNI